MNTAFSCQGQSFSEGNFCWALLSKKETVNNNAYLREKTK
jgi:hypothetical protein